MNTKRPLAGTSTAARLAVVVALAPTAACFALALALAAPATITAQEPEDGLGLPAGTPAPDAQVEDMEGNQVSLLEVIGGRPALIEFWASWCEQCEALQPEIDRVQERFGEEVAVVAVAVAVSQSRRRVRRHVERHAPGYDYVYDASGEAVRAYKALTTSIVVLVDGEGRVVSTGVGPKQELVKAVETLLQDPSSGSGVTSSITAANSS
ncbi:MAG: TlpA disulfide reductase family protein [Gemmatimonadota bacterium]|nr:TlpA disulfide reductase family protein [Gemmatimonadota bacterium]